MKLALKELIDTKYKEITSAKNSEFYDLNKKPRMRIVIRECPHLSEGYLLDSNLIKQLESPYENLVLDKGYIFLISIKKNY